MPRLTAEVTGDYDQPSDASALLYAPLDSPCSYRRTRLYELEFEGETADAEAFVRRVLLDEFAEQVAFGGEPALGGFAFYLDYGMRPGALDLEKEAVLASHAGARHKTIEISSLELKQRIYVFADGAPAPPERFIRDVCNPAIHVWSVTDSDGRNVA